MATCKECIHFEPCWDYGNILDPIHGGVICDSFKPAADVVEVVRCKDCKWRDTDECYIGFYDDSGELFTTAEENDFCSHVERKAQE